MYFCQMKNMLFILTIAFLLTGCSSSNNKLKEHITHSDSIAINFFKGDGTMDTVVAVKFIRNPQQIEQLVTLISQKSAKKNSNCGYDGSLHFFKMNKVIQDIDFRMNADDCMYFSFLLNGQRQSTLLSKEAKALIYSFSK